MTSRRALDGRTPPRPAPKDVQKRQWDVVAPGWSAWFEWMGRNFEPLTAWLRRAAGWQAGARVLDVACGAGYPALAAAAAVRPGGSVVATDLSPEMLAAAARRARGARLDNVEFLERDAEDLRLPAASFDAATCVCGLMFCPRPARAASEMRRVLRDGGRFAAVVWDEPSRNPFFIRMVEVMARFLPLPPADPAAPGPFRLAPADRLASVLGGAGFADVVLESLPMTVECASADEYRRLFTDVAAGWKPRTAALPAEERARLEEAVAEAVAPYVVNGRVRMNATALCASGRR